MHYYAGYLNVTQSDRPCWPWKDQGQVVNFFLRQNYTFDHYDIQIANNYCRTFLKAPEYPEPWCYNGNYGKNHDWTRFEKCNIPLCLNVY
ncbi:hypothetical protein ElyMa_003957700 [Elysia marginata]|uniref:Kringle domain-containing protein n=1 Tax=Elysia marginata TaxID=1093978 RepID=A0AAV4FXI1_9GAST|nr:hypothetical protein ElyMa_003957700 [Elysia marginata]